MTYANKNTSDIGLAKEMELWDLHITTNYYKWPNSFKDLEKRISQYIASLDKASKDAYENYNDVFQAHIFTLKRISKTYNVNDFTGQVIRMISGSDCVRHINILDQSFAKSIPRFLGNFRLRQNRYIEGKNQQPPCTIMFEPYRCEGDSKAFWKKHK